MGVQGGVTVTIEAQKKPLTKKTKFSKCHVSISRRPTNPVKKTQNLTFVCQNKPTMYDPPSLGFLHGLVWVSFVFACVFSIVFLNRFQKFSSTCCTAQAPKLTDRILTGTDRTTHTQNPSEPSKTHPTHVTCSRPSPPSPPHPPSLHPFQQNPT